MEIYLIGGAVRDALLGLPVVDRDWVVVGATPEAMLALGYKPVGRDFPVFLHPVTHEEYALARTERKTAPGYRGFVIHAAPEVTLEQDLARRDITINSIAYYVDYSSALALKNDQTLALTLDPAHLIDPFGGQADLKAKVLRHVTPAFREDPVRILRVARFNARFPEFAVAPETWQLMRDMVDHGEVKSLVPERVWQELGTGLMAQQPARMMDVLTRAGALAQLMPALRPGADAAFAVLDAAARANANLAVRFACLMSHFETDSVFLSRTPRYCSDLASLLARELDRVAEAALSATELVRLFERCDAFRKPTRFLQLLECCALLQGLDTGPLQRAMQAAQTVTSQQAMPGLAAHDLEASCVSGPQIAQAMRDARVRAVAQFLDSEQRLS
jgi:tRNA nucleotidyltransferase (CCA-adding enzyme)